MYYSFRKQRTTGSFNSINYEEGLIDYMGYHFVAYCSQTTNPLLYYLYSYLFALIGFMGKILKIIPTYQN